MYSEKILNKLIGKNIAILGFGREGKSTYSFIRKHLKDMHLTIIDKNTIEIDDQNITLVTGENYLDNLDKKWGDDYLGKGKGWRNAKTLKEYADIVNREDLGLHTKDAHTNYNLEHADHPAYLYTPLWENNNTTLDSDSKLGGIYPRVLKMMELLNNRISEWNKFAKTNNILKN